MKPNIRRILGRPGDSALEFALLVPILAVMTAGLLDYGWFYAEEAMVVGAATSAVRAGATLRPAEGEDVGCTPCLAVVAAHAEQGLRDAGVDASAVDIDPRIERIGGSCGVVLDLTVPHAPLLRFVPIGGAHHVTAVGNADFVEACPDVVPVS